MTYIGIIGSRKRDTPADFLKTSDAFFDLVNKIENGQLRSVVIVSGGCPQGGDSFAENLYNRFIGYGIRIIIHPPDKAKLDQKLLVVNRRAAYARINYVRNELVARDARDYLIACVAADRKGGTEHTIRLWKKYHPKDWKERLVLV